MTAVYWDADWHSRPWSGGQRALARAVPSVDLAERRPDSTACLTRHPEDRPGAQTTPYPSARHELPKPCEGQHGLGGDLPSLLTSGGSWLPVPPLAGQLLLIAFQVFSTLEQKVQALRQRSRTP